MRHWSISALCVAGLLNAAGCSNSDSQSADTGGATSAGGQVAQAGGATGSGGTSQPGSGGATGRGGSAMGGAQQSGGAPGFGGSTTDTGGAGRGGTASGGSSTMSAGGSVTTGGVNAGGTVGALGGGGNGGGVAAGGAATGGANSGTCTASKGVNANVSGSGPHKVTVETNSDSGIREGTIYRPTDLGGAEKYPILVWGNGACSQNGLSNTAAMAEIAAHGYFVVADGTPNGSGSRSQTSDWVSMGKPLLAYISWAIAENDKPCSAYYHSLDTGKIAANGFSCGGLMSEGTSGDPRMTTWGISSSGLTSADQAFYKKVHTPVLIILGGSSDIAYNNGERDYDSISALGIPIMLFSKNIGHGGDLGNSHGGDFTKIHLAWLNWQLKGDEGSSGKGVLVGSGCSYCTDSAWEVKSKNIP